MSVICLSVSSGNEASISSSMQGLNSLYATLMMKKLTTTAAAGSSTLQFSPRRMAPPMPAAVPIEERASLL